MRQDEEGNYLADSAEELERLGYEILYIESFKPGVDRLHVRDMRGPPYNFYLVYVPVRKITQ